jgi:hypothetical protein
MIRKIDTLEINWIKLKERKYYVRLFILEILSKNKYFLFIWNKKEKKL